MDCSPPGSSVHGILQARILEWVAMPSSRGFSWSRDWAHVSCGSCTAGGFFTTELLEKLPQGIYIPVYLSSLYRKVRTPFSWRMATSGWAQDSRSTVLLPHHQPTRRKSHTLQPSPQILPIKTFPQKIIRDFCVEPRVFAWPCNKPFSAPDSDFSVYVASLCLGLVNMNFVP